MIFSLVWVIAAELELVEIPYFWQHWDWGSANCQFTHPQQEAKQLSSVSAANTRQNWSGFFKSDEKNPARCFSRFSPPPTKCDLTTPADFNCTNRHDLSGPMPAAEVEIALEYRHLSWGSTEGWDGALDD